MQLKEDSVHNTSIVLSSEATRNSYYSIYATSTWYMWYKMNPYYLYMLTEDSMKRFPNIMLIGPCIIVIVEE